MLLTSVIVLSLGLANLATVLGNPRFDTTPVVAVVHLTGVGMLFGVALVTLAQVIAGFLRRRMLIFSAIFLSLGLVSLANALGNPRYETIPGVTVFHLVVRIIAIGMLFGMALVLLAQVIAGFPFPDREELAKQKQPSEPLRQTGGA
jgi:hypothetical protein